MNQAQGPRELTIAQAHTGTRLLAGLFALLAACLVATLVFAVVLQLAERSIYLLCLFVPAVGLVLLISSALTRWGEEFIPRFWPSGDRLLLEQDGLTLKKQDRIKWQIRWDEPFSALCWRVRQVSQRTGPTPPPRQLYLACQLGQRGHVISLYTRSSPRDWRRVPGWKQFPLLELPRHSRQWRLPRRAAAPSHRGVSSLPEADLDTLWPAERRRRMQGLALSFDDFCAVLAAVERHSDSQDADDRTRSE